MQFKLLDLKNNKLNIVLILSFLVINSLFVYFYKSIPTESFFVKELVFFFDFILIARFANQGLTYLKEYLKGLKEKTEFTNSCLTIIRKIQFPINIIIFFSFISFFIKPIIIQKLKVNEIIHIYDYFIEYGFIFLLFFTIYQIFSNIRKEKTSTLEIKAKRTQDEDSLMKIKYELTIIHGLFRFFNFLLLAVLLGLFTKKAGISLASILAFGSIVIVVIGMGSRYFLANIFGGLMILFYRPFHIGDKIRIPEKDIEGIVFNIGWLTVKLKNSHKNTTHIPNSMFAVYHVDNQSAKYGNKIEESFKFNIDDIKVVRKLLKNIKTLLEEHSGIDLEESVIVNINNIDGDCFNVKVICTTLPTNETQYSSIKQDLLIKIYDIFKENNIEMYKNSKLIEILKKNEE